MALLLSAPPPRSLLLLFYHFPGWFHYACSCSGGGGGRVHYPIYKMPLAPANSFIWPASPYVEVKEGGSSAYPFSSILALEAGLVGACQSTSLSAGHPHVPEGGCPSSGAPVDAERDWQAWRVLWAACFLHSKWVSNIGVRISSSLFLHLQASPLVPIFPPLSTPCTF